MCPDSQAVFPSHGIRGDALDVRQSEVRRRSGLQVMSHHQSQLPHTPVTDNCIPQAQRPPSLRTS